jgi:hypothetical protein
MNATRSRDSSSFAKEKGMRLIGWCGIALLMGMAAGTWAADAPDAAAEKAETAIVQQAEKWATEIAKSTSEAETQYPGLRKEAEAWGKELHETEAKAAMTQPRFPVADYRFVGVVTEKTHPKLVRYLNFWHRADFGVGQGVNYYPVGTFDKVTSAVPAGNAYVVFREGKDLTVFWFTRPQPGAAWMSGSRAYLQAAARVGAALALMQESLEAVRAGKPLSTVPITEAKWTWGNPAKWMFMGQDTHGGPRGLFVWQERLSPKKQQAELGAWVREDDQRDLAVEFHLRQTAELDKFMGWKLERIEKTEEPVSEPVR